MGSPVPLTALACHLQHRQSFTRQAGRHEPVAYLRGQSVHLPYPHRDPCLRRPCPGHRGLRPWLSSATSCSYALLEQSQVSGAGSACKLQLPNLLQTGLHRKHACGCGLDS